MRAGAVLTLLLTFAAGAFPAFAAQAPVQGAAEISSGPVLLTAEAAAERAAIFAPAVLQAREALREAELGAVEAGLRLLPDATLSGGTGVNQAGPRSSAQASFSGSLSPRLSWNLSVNSAVPDFDPGFSASLRYTLLPEPAPGAWGEVDKARERVERARASLAQAEANAAMVALRTLERLQIAEARLAIAEAELREAEALLRTTEYRSRLGEASEIDVIRAEISLLNAQAAVEERRQAAEDLRSSLGELVGIEPHLLLVPPFDPTALEAFEPFELPSRDEAVEAALAASLDLADRARDLESARAELARALANRGLSVGVTGSSGKEPGRDLTWSVMLNVQYDLGGQGELAVARERAQRSVEQAEKSLNDAQASVVSRVDEALRLLESDLRTLQARERNERIRTLELMAAQERHRRGLINDAQLAAAERNLLSAQLDRFETISSYKERYAQLLVLMGRPPVFE